MTNYHTKRGHSEEEEVELERGKQEIVTFFIPEQLRCATKAVHPLRRQIAVICKL
jgi:hypothetical protein